MGATRASHMAFQLNRAIIVILVLFVGSTAPATMAIILDVLWESSVIADVTHLARSLETMSELNNRSVVNIMTHDVTGLSQNALHSLVCGQLSSSRDILFVSAVGCYLQMALRSVADTTGAVVVATRASCDLGAPSRAGLNYVPYPPISPGLGPVVADLFAELGDWRDVAIIYDDATASRFDAIIGNMMGTNATLQAYKVRAQHEDDDVSIILNDLRTAYTIPRHILMVCSLQCQLTVIDQVGNYDVIHKVQAQFKFEDRWILVADRFELRTLEGALGWMDNVAVIVPLVLNDKSSESVVEEVTSLVLRSLQAINTSTEATVAASSCGPPSSLVEDVIEQLQYLIDQIVCPQCDAYEVVTIMYTPEGRGASTVATWSPSGLSTTASIFPNLLYGLNARNLVVSTNIWEPFVLKAENGSLPYEGLSIELLMELARSANFTFNLTQPEDGKWGGQTNGTWNGLIGQLQQKEVDMVVAPLSVQSSRKEVVDYAEPYYNEYTTVLAKLPEASATKWRLYISPFKWQVWLALAGSIPLIGFIIWSFTNLSPYYTSHNEKSGLAKLENAVLYTYGSLFTQGGIYLPRAQSGRFVVGFWWMYCIVVVATYSGNLIAFLTVSIPALPFDNLEDMVAQTDIKYGVMQDTATYNELQVSHNNILRNTWNGIQEFMVEDPEVLGLDHGKLIQKVLGGGYAYMNDRTGFELAMSTHCSIQMIKETFLPLPYAVALQKQSAYEPIISREVVKVKEGGLITKWKKIWWPHQSFCSRGMVTQAKAVSLEDVQGAYYAAAMLLFLASITLLVESIVKCIVVRWKRGKVPTEALSNGTLPKKKLSQRTPSNGTLTNGVHANGIVHTGEEKDNKVWGIYSPTAQDENVVGVRDIYTNQELVDIFGRSANKEIGTDLFSDPSNSMAMVDILGNPINSNGAKEPVTVDKYSRVIHTETGETIDMFGRTLDSDQELDKFGRPVINEPVDKYGRPLSPN